MTDPKKNKPAELKEDQLGQVSGGTQTDGSAIPMDDELVGVQPMPVNPQAGKLS